MTVRIDRLLELADDMERSSKHVDLRHWNTCICGWAIDKWGTPTSVFEPPFYEGRRLLGISEPQSLYLFGGSSSHLSEHRGIAVERLRRLALTVRTDDTTVADRQPARELVAV